MREDKLIKTVTEMEVPSGYTMSFREVKTLISKFEKFNLASAAFNYGFLKGRRAEKAASKREQKKRLEQDTSGWYGYLSQWLERNRGNERLLGLVGRFAGKLEGSVPSSKHL